MSGTHFSPARLNCSWNEDTLPSLGGDLHLRTAAHQCFRPVILGKGTADQDLTVKDDYYALVEVVPGKDLMQKPDAFGRSVNSYT